MRASEYYLRLSKICKLCETEKITLEERDEMMDELNEIATDEAIGKRMESTQPENTGRIGQ